MPVYAYVCNNCSATTELIRPIAHMDNIAACHRCGGTNTRRTLSMFAVGGRAEEAPGQSEAGHACAPAASNITMNDCSVINCGGAAIKADGNVAIHGNRFVSRGNKKTFETSGDAHVHFGAVDIS